MADISACSGLKQDKGKVILSNQCPQRHGCKRYDAHLNAVSKQQSYIKAAFVGQSCEFFKQ